MTVRLETTEIAGRQVFAVLGVVATGLFVGLAAWQTTLLLLVAAVSAWCGFSRPDLGLGILALTLPMQTHIEVGIEASTLTLTKVVLWSLIGGWTFALLLGQRRVMIDFVTVALSAVVITLVISAWNARDGGIWLGETYRWLSTTVIACLAFNVFRREGSPLPFLAASAAGVVGSVVVSIWQVANSYGPESFEVRGFLRAYGPFTHPNQLAVYLELVAPLFAALLLGRPGSVAIERQWYISAAWRYLWAIGLAASVVGLILSQSRGGLVGMAAGLVIVVALNRPKLRWSVIRIAPIGLLVALTFLTISIAIVAAGVKTFASEETLVTPSNFAVQERLSHWTAAVEMAKAHPFAGVGAGNFDLAYRDYTQEWRFRVGRGHAHNTYLQFLAQAGVVGLTAYIALLLGVSLIIVRTMRILPQGARLSILIGVAGVTAAASAHAVFEYVHVLSLNHQLVIVWAAATAIGTDAWSERERTR